MRIELFPVEDVCHPDHELTDFNGVRKREFTDGGIYSERIFGRMHGGLDEYSCRCGETAGMYNRDILCPSCKTPVVRRESGLGRTGWIGLGRYKAINPLYLPFIKKYLGQASYARYVGVESVVIDVDGKASVSDDHPKSEAHPELVGIGINKFCASLERILDDVHAARSKGRRVDKESGTYEFLKKHVDCVTTGRIPVFSHRLRPAIMIRDQLVFDKINPLFTQIMRSAATLRSLSKSSFPLMEDSLMLQVQKLYEAVHAHVVDAVSGKEGLIRQSVLGNRLNFSSRCVIVPIDGFAEIDEVHVPYLCAVEFFRLSIINYLTKVKNISYDEAGRRWSFAASSFDDEVYEAILDIVDRLPYGMRILFNRNPTISLGSILQLRVTKIKDRIDDYTMSIPNNILKFVAGDYDGDVLNIYLLVNESHVRQFERLNPKNLVLNPNDGRINPAIHLDKDHALGIHSLLA